jgi:hypothetical protein
LKNDYKRCESLRDRKYIKKVAQSVNQQSSGAGATIQPRMGETSRKRIVKSRKGVMSYLVVKYS